MSLSRWATRRPVAVGAAFAALAVSGGASLARLPVRLLPDVQDPGLVVAVSDADVAPAEMERAVTAPVERALAGMPALEEMRSVSGAGWSTVTLRFAWGTSMDFAAIDVRERLDELRQSLPPSASRPLVLRRDAGSEPFMVVTLADARGADAAGAGALTTLAERIVKRRLEQIDGVAQAAVIGGAHREVLVRLDQHALDRYTLRVADVTTAIADADASDASGTVRRGSRRFAVRTDGQLATRAELADVLVPAPGARGGRAEGGRVTVRLADLGAVVDTLAPRRSVARLDGREAIALLLYREAGADVVEAAARVDEALAELRRAYPALAFGVASSQAPFVSAAIAGVAQEVVLGALLAVAVLFFFVRDPRVPAIIAVVVPLAVVSTFALLDLAGASLDVMTLGGLALGVALLMDNSIVVVENIVRNRELGCGALEAAARGAEEVAAPVVASTITTVAAFAPLAFAGGVAGALFAALALSVAAALTTSVAVALVLVPALAARWPPRPAAERSDVGRSGRSGRLLVRGYERAVSLALDHRGTVAVACVALFVATVVVSRSLPRAVLPAVAQGEFRLTVALPRGTPLERTDSTMREADSLLRAIPGVTGVFARAGRVAPADGTVADAGDVHLAVLDVRASPGAPLDSVIARARRALASLGGSLAFDPAARGTPLGRLRSSDGGASIELRVVGDDPRAAATHAARLALRLEQVPSIARVRVNATEESPEVRVRIDRERAAAFGVRPSDVAAALAERGRPTAAGALATPAGPVPVVVAVGEARDSSLAAIGAATVDGVPVAALTTLRLDQTPAEIRRVAGERALSITAHASPHALRAAVAAVGAVLDSVPAPPGLRVEVGGESERVADAFAGLLAALALAVGLAYLVLAAEFESLLHPLTVLLSVPLALCGAVAALWATGAGLNAVSLIGCIVLVGIVDNDAVVKVDFILRMRRAGLGVREATLAAGRARLRPIVINTATALLGLLPMAFALGPGAALHAPLAIALVGGLFAGTALTLVVVPVAFSLAEDARRRWRRG